MDKKLGGGCAVVCFVVVFIKSHLLSPPYAIPSNTNIANSPLLAVVS